MRFSLPRLATLFGLLLFAASGTLRAQAPDEMLRNMTREERQLFWRSMTPQQRQDFWRQLTPEQRQSIRNHIQSQQPMWRGGPGVVPGVGPQLGPNAGPRMGPWTYEGPRRLPPPGTPGVYPPHYGPPGAPMGPRAWSPEERRRLREQIQQWNREAHEPRMPPRMGER